MRLVAHTGDQEHQLDLTIEGTSVSVNIDGRTYTLEVHQHEQGNYLIMDHPRVYDCRAGVKGQKSADSYQVNVRSNIYEVNLVNPKKLRTSQSADHDAGGSAEITAPMPGKVVKVLVQDGTEVEKGDGILVVEAMKMQNEMKAPRAGVVKSVKVKAGDTVNSGDVLAVIE